MKNPAGSAPAGFFRSSDRCVLALAAMHRVLRACRGRIHVCRRTANGVARRDDEAATNQRQCRYLLNHFHSSIQGPERQ